MYSMYMKKQRINVERYINTVYGKTHKRVFSLSIKYRLKRQEFYTKQRITISKYTQHERKLPNKLLNAKGPHLSAANQIHDIENNHSDKFPNYNTTTT
jgi:hypothetical protein